jgi:hypothetical protein
MKQMEQMIAESLKEYPEVHFDELDREAINKIVNFAIGYYGVEAREAALDLLDRYISWVKKQNKDDFEDVGIDPMAALKQLEDLVNCARNFAPDYEHREEIGNKFREFRTAQKNIK